MRVSLLCFIIGLSSTFNVHLYANEKVSSYSGTVLSNGSAVPYVAVYIDGTSQGTITDKNGYFLLQGDALQDVVIAIQGLGYKTTYFEVTARNLGENLNISIEPDTLLLEQVVVSGSRVGVLRHLPGSAAFIDHNYLKQTQPISGNEVLRNISGINVVEEEGAGLRANIGIRGLDPDRSRTVLVLEDGVPVALAPYGEPEMYFTPNIDRMSGLEVLKGSGSILFGPQTIGGVINYLTPDAPESPSGFLRIKGGDFGYFSSILQYGNTINNNGFLVNYTRKQADTFGPTHFRLNDFNVKLNTKFSPISQLVVRLGYYDETSNSTYVGITQSMYDAGSWDDQRVAPDDQLDVKRYSMSASHKYLLSNGLQLNTTVFGYTTSRNWLRQDFTHNPEASNLTGVVHGIEDGYDGAIYLRNSTGQRNRQFEVAGIEPRLQYLYDFGGRSAKLDFGMRFLYEQALEQRVNGTMAGALSGNLINDEVRSGQAVSIFVQNLWRLTHRLSFTAGLRSENIWYNREIHRAGSEDLFVSADSEVFALIPGAGLNYSISDDLGLFGGLHKGFAPPRIKDAISDSGVDYELDAEESWNSELGIRFLKGAIQWEMTGFYMDFSNQVIPVSESSGGVGAGYVNGGRTIHSGVESSLQLPMTLLLPDQWAGHLLLTGTYVNSEFSETRNVVFKTDSESGDVIYQDVKGNKTPYTPSFNFAAGIQVESPGGLGLSVTANFTGKQYSDVLNTKDVSDWIAIDEADAAFSYAQATMNGRIGQMDAFYTLGMNGWYKHRSGLGLNFAIKNMTNQRYIASRRPQGIKVGMPRFVSAGLTFDF